MKIEIKKSNGEIVEIDAPEKVSSDYLKSLNNPLLNQKKPFDFLCWPAKFVLRNEN